MFLFLFDLLFPKHRCDFGNYTILEPYEVVRRYFFVIYISKYKTGSYFFSMVIYIFEIILCFTYNQLIFTADLKSYICFWRSGTVWNL